MASHGHAPFGALVVFLHSGLLFDFSILCAALGRASHHGRYPEPIDQHYTLPSFRRHSSDPLLSDSVNWGSDSGPLLHWHQF
ncbi:MAG: hypothetical protein AAFW95_05970 [Cyanobacteria bacterium J06638_6]